MEYKTAYKTFNHNFVADGFKVGLGLVVQTLEYPRFGKSGFICSLDPSDCFNMLGKFDILNRVAEVQVLGDIDDKLNTSVLYTNKYQVIREIAWDELIAMLTLGRNDLPPLNMDGGSYK